MDTLALVSLETDSFSSQIFLSCASSAASQIINEALGEVRRFFCRVKLRLYSPFITKLMKGNLRAEKKTHVSVSNCMNVEE